MLKRIHSNRKPGDTLWTEIYRDFAPYFTKAGAWSAALLERKPRLGLYAMIALLLFSSVLSFTVFRHPQTVSSHVHPVAAAAPLHEGIDQLLTAAAAIRENVRLRHFVDSLAAKRTLSAADSMALDTALSRLERLTVTSTHP